MNIRIKKISNNYNSLDTINNETVLLHTTNRITQPCKEGLKVDFEIHKSKLYIFKEYIKKLLGRNYDNKVTNFRYLRHPDEQIIKVVKSFFNFAKQNKIVNEIEIDQAIKDLSISKIFLKD